MENNNNIIVFNSKPFVDLQEFLNKDFDSSVNFDIDENAAVNDETTEEMRVIMDLLREQIKKETTGYQLPSGR